MSKTAYEQLLDAQCLREQRHKIEAMTLVEFLELILFADLKLRVATENEELPGVIGRAEELQRRINELRLSERRVI